MAEYKPPTIKDVFHNAWQNFLEAVGQSFAATAAEIPAIQEKMEEAKTEEAKNVLWRFFPIGVIAVIVFVLIKALK